MTSQSLPIHVPAPSTTTQRLRDFALATRADLAAPLLRVGLAVVMFPHGAQKLLGWFGGHGYEGTMGFLTGAIGLPTPLAALTIGLEFFGPILLLLGLAVRPIAAGFVAIMLGAITTVHAPYGFFMNWTGAQQGEGFEYHLLVIVMSLALLVRGAGSFSFDRLLAKQDPA